MAEENEKLAKIPEEHRRKLKNGAIMDRRTGEIVGHSIKDPQHFRDLARKRWDKYRKKTEEGLSEHLSTHEGRGKTHWDAWKNVVVNQYEVATTGKGKESTIASQFIGKALSALPEQRFMKGDGGGLKLEISEESAVGLSRALVALARSRRMRDDSDILDGEYLEE